jgi:hypothetical protein
MISEIELSTKQKKTYIKRQVDNDVLNMETIRNIYKIVRCNEGLTPIRDSKDVHGIFVDLNKINPNTIDLIYILIKKRMDTIAII